jgi:hypothetical protein
MAFKPRIACVAVRYAVLNKSESRGATYLVYEILAVILGQALGPDDSVSWGQLCFAGQQRIAYRSVSMSSYTLAEFAINGDHQLTWTR